MRLTQIAAAALAGWLGAAGPERASSASAPAAPHPPAPGTLDCRAAFAQPLVLWPADRRMVPVEIRNVKGRPDEEIRIEVTRVRENEPPQAAGEDGGKNPRARYCPDAETAHGKLELRAERVSPGAGRLYVVEFRASAAGGATCSGEVVVRVPIEKGKKQDDGPSRRDATYDATRCE